ncbi:hypothetical protein J7J58_06270 [candidate division WOR-3 bacterium]|nr:hypothetical protein [candidate division WOR-3 bacterium]
MKLEMEMICPNCGKSMEGIKSDKRLGCAFCYTVFSDYIEKMLKMSQGTFVHIGMAPKKSEKKEKLKNAYFKAKKALKSAIKEENYEKAHRISEDIKLIEEQLSAES